MRVRFRAVSISSVLLTIGLTVLVPHNLERAATWKEEVIQETNWLHVGNYLMPLGFAALALVAVGLLVIWTGFRNRVRSAWFVVFCIVWVFVFPVYVLPTLLRLHAGKLDNWSGLSEWLRDALRSPGMARDYAKGPADFLLMLVALFLPIRSFFGRRPAAKNVGTIA